MSEEVTTTLTAHAPIITCNDDNRRHHVYLLRHQNKAVIGRFDDDRELREKLKTQRSHLHHPFTEEITEQTHGYGVLQLWIGLLSGTGAAIAAALMIIGGAFDLFMTGLGVTSLIGGGTGMVITENKRDRRRRQLAADIRDNSAAIRVPVTKRMKVTGFDHGREHPDDVYTGHYFFSDWRTEEAFDPSESFIVPNDVFGPPGHWPAEDTPDYKGPPFLLEWFDAKYELNRIRTRQDSLRTMHERLVANNESDTESGKTIDSEINRLLTRSEGLEDLIRAYEREAPAAAVYAARVEENDL